MAFGDVAFSGSRFIFWCVAPVLAICAIGVPLLVDEWTPLKIVLSAAWALGCLAAILALYNARRYWLAARGVTGIIFLGYLAYVIDQVLLSGKPIEPTRRSDASPWNSILGFIIIGLPALWYTLFGRFSPRRPEGVARGKGGSPRTS